MGLLQVSEIDCDALLFDLDGTLVDSTEVVERLWREWAARFSLDAEEILAVSHGRRAEEIMRLVLPDLPNPAEEAAARIRQEEEQTEGLVPIPGAPALLESLPPDRWAVFTSCTGRLAEVRLTSVGLPVPAVLITADAVDRGKPDPEGFLRAARELGWEPRRCVVVEDARAGVEAGHAAGMKVVGVTTTLPAEVLRADIHVPDLKSVRVDRGERLTLRIDPRGG